MPLKTVLSLSLLLSISTYATIPLSVQELRNRVLTQNREVLATQKEDEAAEKETGHLFRSYFPELTLVAAQDSFQSGTESTKTQPQWGAEISLNLLKGGLDTLNNKLIKTRKEMSQKNRSVTEMAQIKEAQTLYWQVLFLEAKRKLIEEELNKSAQAIKAASRRVQRGVATASDLLEFELYQSELALQKSEVEILLEETLQKLRINLNYSEDEPLILPKDFQLLDLESTGYPELQSNLTQLIALEAEVQLLDSRMSQLVWRPELELFASTNQFNERIDSAGPGTPSSERQETVLGIRLTLDLGNVLDLANQKRVDELKSEAQKLRLSQSAEKQLLELKNEMKLFSILRKEIPLKRLMTEKTRKYYQLTREDYDRGVKNSPDLLGAMERAFRSEISYLEAVRDYNSIVMQ